MKFWLKEWNEISRMFRLSCQFIRFHSISQSISVETSKTQINIWFAICMYASWLFHYWLRDDIKSKRFLREVKMISHIYKYICIFIESHWVLENWLVLMVNRKKRSENTTYKQPNHLFTCFIVLHKRFVSSKRLSFCRLQHQQPKFQKWVYRNQILIHSNNIKYTQ